MRKILFFFFSGSVVLLLGLMTFSCNSLGCSGDATFSELPDTLNLLPLPTSTEMDVRKEVVYAPVFLDNGEKRPKGQRDRKSVV